MLTQIRWFDIFSLLMLVILAMQWSATVRVYGRVSLKLIEKVVRLSLRTVKSFLLVAGLLGLVGTLGTVLFPDFFPPFPVSMSLVLSLTAISGVCLPPSFLLLAATDQRIVSIASDLTFAVPPLRLVHALFDFEFGAAYGDMLFHQSIRNRNNNSWKALVREVMELVPIIIIDTRILTQSVIEETCWALSPDLRHKTTFIVESDSNSPVLSVIINPAAPLPIYTVTEERLKQHVRKLKRRIRHKDYTGRLQACEGCGRQMKKLEPGFGNVMLSREEILSGEGVAEECWECGRLYCDYCYPNRPPNSCVCERGRSTLRKLRGVVFHGSMRLMKVHYIEGSSSFSSLFS